MAKLAANHSWQRFLGFTPVLQLTLVSENHNVFWNIQVKLGDGVLNLFSERMFGELISSES